jgi:glycosyltransferase involved in cell wall biosynthesis
MRGVKKLANQRPLVSVILATFNEASHVRKCVESLLMQETPDFDLEILAVDGGSTDGTRRYLDELAPRFPEVRVLHNPERRTPFAFNIGIREARGEYVCVFGSHTVYNSDYISVCLEELIAKGAVGCGGRVLAEPASETLQSRLVAFALAHPFGSSRKSFRTQPEGFAETVNYMIVRKNALLEVGGYSESLLRNQDNDLNQKLCAAGHRLFCTWKTHCVYHPKETVRQLFGYGYTNGYWNVISCRENFASMGLRHFVPLFFVLAVIGATVLGGAGLLAANSPYRLLALCLPALLAIHLGAGIVAAGELLRQKRFVGAFCLPFVFLGFHLSYGLGSLVAIATAARAPKKGPSSAGPPPIHKKSAFAEVLQQKSGRDDSVQQSAEAR